MDPLSVTASIIAVVTVTGKFAQYLRDVQDGPEERVNCATEASNLYRLFIKLSFHLEGQNVDAPWFKAVRDLAFKDGPLDQLKKALETLLAKVEVASESRKVVQALKWKFDEEEVKSILDRMERLKVLVVIALGMDHFKLSQAIKDGTDALLTQVPAIQSGVAEIQQGQTDTKHRELLEWISTTNHPAEQSDIMKRWQQRTGQWFLSHPQVAKWRNETSSTLFCPGMPGAGKTIIAAIAVDHLLKSALNSSTGVAYVYCNYKEKQDTLGMLAAILKQLAQPNMEPVERLRKRCSDRETCLLLDEVIGFLEDVVDCYDSVYIIIDALNECQDGSRRQLFAKLTALRTGRDIRIMATSRCITEIEERFRTALQLEVQADKADVHPFVEGQIDQLPMCIQRDRALQEKVRDRIAETSDGMFLLARLHTKSLHGAITPRDVMSVLDELSSGLSGLKDAYSKVMDKIEGQLPRPRELANQLLSWITFAKRPLTAGELCHALAVIPGDSKLDPSNIPEVDDLVSVCAGLVVYDQQSNVIRLVHYTTQKLLEDISTLWDPAPQLLITTACLTYLSFDAFKSGKCSSTTKLRERLREHKLLGYAALNWGEHARPVETTVIDAARPFLLHNHLISCAKQAQDWVTLPRRKKMRARIRDLFGGWIKPTTGATGLHCTAYFGLSALARSILPTAQEDLANSVNARMSTGETPLMVAAAKGYSDMNELLLDQGADVDAEARSRSRHGNALEAASRMGHKQVVKLLLDNMAYINAKSDYFSSELGVALLNGNDQIVELLLSSGANVNAPGRFGLALSCAVSGGHAEIVALLIHNGADVNARNYSNMETDNPLWTALSERRIKIAKLLLSHGAIALVHPEKSRPRAAIAAPSKPKGRRSTSVETRRVPTPTQPAPRRMSLSDAGSATRAGQKCGRPGATRFDTPSYYGTGRTRTGRATIASTAWPSLTPASSRRLVLLLLLLALVLLPLLILWLSR